MPIFEVEHNGQVYEVDAPDIQQAASAARAFSPAAPQSPPSLGDSVPLPGGGFADAAGNPVEQTPDPPAPEPSLWDRVKTAKTGDPIIDMWLHGLVSTAAGAPETAANMVSNAGTMATAGLTAPFVAKDDDDAANFTRDFLDENLMRPRNESAQQLTTALGEAFAPVEKAKEALGGGALEATDSPLAATAAFMAPDVLSTVLGGPKVTKAAAALPEKPLKADAPPVNPTVENLRAADIRMRPSDVRAMEPNRKVKVPGERRERFADAPDLKKDTNLHNQARFTDLAAEELGIKKLDDASFEEAYKKPAATYDMVEDVLRDREMSQAFADTFRKAAASARLPKGEGASVTRVIGALRRRAAKRMQSEDVKTEEAGFADRELAERLEAALGRELDAAGEPQLLKQYQDARQQYAKIHDVQTATRAGQVDAAVLYKLNKKAEGKRLSGRLKLIADAYESVPNVSAHSLKTASRAGDEVPGSREGVIKELLKAGIRKIPGMDVGAEGFQNVFGKPDPTRTANYGRPTDLPGPRTPEQPELDLREILALETPGEMGPRPPRKAMGKQESLFGKTRLLLDLQPPRGRVGREPTTTTTARSLEDVMIDGEPLAEPAVNFRAETLADILGLSDPMVKKPKKSR